MGCRTLLRIAAAAVLFCYAPARPVSAQDGAVTGAAQDSPAATSPGKALIPGVPFIGYQEAAGFKYPDKDIANPSIYAAYGMVLRYWGKAPKSFARWDEERDLAWATTTAETAHALGQLKPLIARRVPVIVPLAATPVAHYLNPPVLVFLSFAKDGGIDVDELRKLDSSTEILGPMAALDRFPKIMTAMGGKVNPIRESVYASFRVLVGYDDDRKVVILHDPSCGPAFELSYQDFDTMWGATERRYIAIHPRDYTASQETATAEPYRERTPAEKAAWYYLRGYAFSSIGRAAEAAAVLQEGLALAGIGKPYEHLLRVELASALRSTGRRDESVDEAQKAVDLLPEHFLSWAVLERALQDRSGPDDERRAREAHNKLEALVKDKKAARRVAATLPRDFWIPALAPIRGWADQ